MTGFAGAPAALRLLYCTPEKIVNSKRFLARLEKLYKAGRLKLVAIDEAHCCRQVGGEVWGWVTSTSGKRRGGRCANMQLTALGARAVSVKKGGKGVVRSQVAVAYGCSGVEYQFPMG